MNYAQLLVPDFSLIVIGLLLCRYTALNRTVWEQVEVLVYYCLFPVLLFHSIVRSTLDLGAASSLIAAAISLGLLAIASAYVLPHLPGLGRFMPARLHAASTQVAFRFNSFIGLALAERLGGAQGLLMIAVLIGVCVPMFNVAAVWPMARHAQRNLARELVRNPLIIATLSGLACNLMRLHVPAWLDPALARIGAASLPLGLMSAGAGLRFSSLRQAKALALCVLGIKHLLLPLLALGLSYAFHLTPLQATILLAFSALPTASTCYVLAVRMGYDGAYVAGLVTLSTVLGTVSLWFALGVLRP